MKTTIKPLLVALTVSILAATSSFANPIGRKTAVASYKTGIYTSVSGKLHVALDKETNGTVDISLKNAKGHVLYSKHLSKAESTCRTRLNLDDLEDGTYYLEITNGVETTRQTVTIATHTPNTPTRTVAMVTPTNN